MRLIGNAKIAAVSHRRPIAARPDWLTRVILAGALAFGLAWGSGSAFGQEAEPSAMDLPPELVQAIEGAATGAAERLQETLERLVAANPERAEAFFAAVFRAAPQAGLEVLLNMVGGAAQSGDSSARAFIKAAVQGAVSGTVATAEDLAAAAQQVQEIVTFATEEVVEAGDGEVTSLVGDVTRGATLAIVETATPDNGDVTDIVKAAAEGAVAGILNIAGSGAPKVAELIREATSATVESILQPIELEVAEVEALIEAVGEGTAAGISETLGAGSTESQQLLESAEAAAEESTELIDFQTAGLEPEAEADQDDSVSPN